MAHAARIEDGIVREVIVVPDNLDATESDAAIEAYIHSIGLQGTWIRTSYNAATNGFRGTYAGIGFTFDAERNAFISPKPFPSWVLDEDSCQWVAPVAPPSGEGFYDWNEMSGSWVEAIVPVDDVFVAPAVEELAAEEEAE